MPDVWGPILVDGRPVHVGPFSSRPDPGWYARVREVAAELEALLAYRPPRPRVPRDVYEPPPRRRRQPGSSRPRVKIADTPPVMLTWITAGDPRLAGPEPLELPAPGLAPIHAAAIARADVRPRAIGWRARRRPREPVYCPLYDGVAAPDPLDVAHRQWSVRSVAARRRLARLAR
jgi:hypothetical protein